MINILKMFLFECIYQRMCLVHHCPPLLFFSMAVDSFLEAFVSHLFSLKNIHLFFGLDSHDTMNYHLSMYTGAKVIAVK
jgi:hypothetical protein